MGLRDSEDAEKPPRVSAAPLDKLIVRKFAVTPTAFVGSSNVTLEWEIENASAASIERVGAPTSDELGRLATAVGSRSAHVDRRASFCLRVWRTPDDRDPFETFVEVAYVSWASMLVLLFAIAVFVAGMWICSEQILRGVDAVDNTWQLTLAPGASRVFAFAATIAGVPLLVALARLGKDDWRGRMVIYVLQRKWMVLLALLVGVAPLLYGIYLLSSSTRLRLSVDASVPVLFWSCEDGRRTQLRLTGKPGLTTARVIQAATLTECVEPSRVTWTNKPLKRSKGGSAPTAVAKRSPHDCDYVESFASQDEEQIDFGCGVSLDLCAPPVATSAAVTWSNASSSQFSKPDVNRVRTARFDVADCKSFPTAATLELTKNGRASADGLRWSFPVFDADVVELRVDERAVARLVPEKAQIHLSVRVADEWTSTTRCATAECRYLAPSGTDAPREYCVTPDAGSGERCGSTSPWALTVVESLDAPAWSLSTLLACVDAPSDGVDLEIIAATASWRGSLPKDGRIPWPAGIEANSIEVRRAGERVDTTVDALPSGEVRVRLASQGKKGSVRAWLVLDGKAVERVNKYSIALREGADCGPERVEIASRSGAQFTLAGVTTSQLREVKEWTLRRGEDQVATCTFDPGTHTFECDSRGGPR